MSSNITQNTDKITRTKHDFWVWVLLLVIILSAAVIRIRLLAVPLERDEGEYAYAGQLILQAIPPYAQVYNMKLPGIYAAYALILALFGQSHIGVHMGLLVINAATILLLFLLAKKLFNSIAGLTAAAAFAILSVSQSVQGIFANAEHFVILPAIGGILLLLRFLDHQKPLPLLASGILLGLAFLMKQHGIAFILFAGLTLFLTELRRRPLNYKLFVTRHALFVFAVLLPFGLTCLILLLSGVFQKFWFWTFDYAKEYVSALPLSVGLKILKIQLKQIIGSATSLWIIAGFGLTALLWNKKIRRHALFVVGFLLFSFLAVCPGLYFRTHYFILLLPAVALFVGIGTGCLWDLFANREPKLLAKTIPILLILFTLFRVAYKQKDFLFYATPTTAARMTYGLNPFPESLEIARFINQNSTPDDTIAVIGSEPQIYFYSKRHSATGHIYTYALMEPHQYALQMQKEMISQIESAEPKFLVFVNIPTSWLAGPNSEKLIIEWFQQYQQNYQMVGVVDILGSDQIEYRWNQQLQDYSIRSKFWLSVLQRKDDKPPPVEPDNNDVNNLNL